METKAQLFLRHLKIRLGDLVLEHQADMEQEHGIVYVRFEDGSYVDFTEPLAFTKEKDA
jgi:hypothetical protein